MSGCDSWSYSLLALPMDEKVLENKHSSKEVTEVVVRKIVADDENDYDDWFHRFMISEMQFPRYLGTPIYALGGNTSSVRYTIHRFSSYLA